MLSGEKSRDCRVTKSPMSILYSSRISNSHCENGQFKEGLVVVGALIKRFLPRTVELIIKRDQSFFEKR